MKLNKNSLAGVYTALVTPFDENGGLDMQAYTTLIAMQLDGGVAGLVVVGTTGESATLSDSERDRLIEATVAQADGKIPVVVGTGSYNTETAVRQTKRAQELGADGCLVVTPYYNKPTQLGLLEYFKTVAAATSLPIILYSIPGRCGVEIAIDTAAELSNIENIIAIKEAGDSVARVTELRLACNDDFTIHCGDDGLALPFLSTGSTGATSVVSNVFPELMVSLIQKWQEGNNAKALELHDQLTVIANAMFVESSPVPVKAALQMKGVMKAKVRAPLVQLSKESEAIVKSAVDGYQGNT